MTNTTPVDHDFSWQGKEYPTLAIPSTLLLPNTTNVSYHGPGGPGGSGEASSHTAVVRRAFVIATAVPAVAEIILCSIVLYAAYRVKAYRSAVNFLVVNSAAADLLRGVHGLFAPLLFYDLLNYTDTNQKLCVCYMWVNLMQYGWSMWSIALIAYSRYDLVAHPFDRVLTLKRAITAVCVVFFGSILLACLPLAGWNRYGLEPLRPGSPRYRCAYANASASAGHKAFLPVFYSVTYLVPLIMVGTCYSLIIPIVIRHKKQKRWFLANNLTSLQLHDKYNDPSARGGHNSSSGSDGGKRSQSKLSDRSSVSEVVGTKAFCYVTAIVVTNIIFPLPFVVVQIIRFLELVDIDILVIPIVKFIFTFNFVVNSFFYVLWVRDFRDGLLDVLGCVSLMQRLRNRRRTKKPSTNTTNTDAVKNEVEPGP
jgi:hypothetical protein